MKAYRSFPFYKGTLIDNKGNQGTATGAVFSQMSKGYAIRTSDTETLSYSETPLPSGAFSVVVWAKLEGTNDIASNFMAAISDVVNGNYIALSSPGSKNPSIKMAGSNYRVFNYTVDHQWHCYVFNLPGSANSSISSSSLYVDGVSIAASSTVASGAQASRAGWTNIGGNLIGTGRSFIANLKVYPAVLTEDQVADEQREFERAAIVQYPKRNFQYVKPTDLSREAETHLSKIFGEVDLTTWTAVSATINSASTFTLTGVTGGVKKNLGLITGNTYKVKITGTRNSTTFSVKSFDGVTTYGSVAGGPFDTTIKFQATDAGIYLYTDGVGNIGVMYSIEVWSYDGLIAAYSFSPKTVIGGYLKDISGNRKHLANTLCTLTRDGMRYINAKSGPLNIGSIRSVAMRIKLNSINEKILEGAVASNLVYVSSGILTGSTFRNFYVNGVETKIVEAGKWQTIVMTSETYQSFAALTIGLNDTTYGNIEMYDLRFYSQILTVNDAINYHNKWRVTQLCDNFKDSAIDATNIVEWMNLSGTGKIRENTVMGKFWQQSTSGSMQIQSSQTHGDWTFYINKVLANTTKIKFIWDGSSGYELEITSNNSIRLNEIQNGVLLNELFSTSSGALVDSINYIIKIVRLPGVGGFKDIQNEIVYPMDTFAVFYKPLNGSWQRFIVSSGSNPIASSKYITSVYFRIDLGANDRFGYLVESNQPWIDSKSNVVDFIDYIYRVNYDGGFIDDYGFLIDVKNFLDINSLSANTRLLISPMLAGKNTTSGIYKFWSNLYSYIGQDVSQGTAGSRPYLSGNISPFEVTSIKNPNGDTRYLSHPEISYAANEAWSFVIALNNNSTSAATNVIYSDTGGNTAIYYKNTTNVFAFKNASGTTVSGTVVNYGQIGKNTMLHFVAKGDDTLEIYVNKVLFDTLAVATDAVFQQTGGQGVAYYYRMQSLAMTPAQITAEYDLLRSWIPEIESVTIGSQTWASSNLDVVATPLGNVIPNVTENGAVVVLNKTFNSDIEGTNTVRGSESWNSTDSCLTVTGNSITTAAIRYFDSIVVNKWYKIKFKARRISGSGTPILGFGFSFINSITRPAITSSFQEYVFVSKAIFSSAEISCSDAPTNIGDVVEFDDITYEELNWSNATEIYDAAYAATAGTSAQKEYAALKEAAMWCYFDNSTANGAIYGKILNGYAIKLLRLDMITANYGYKPPLQADWDALETYLDVDAGNDVKHNGTTFWSAPNGGTNSSGLTILPGGYRNELGAFIGLNDEVYMITADETDDRIGGYARLIKD